MAVSLPLAASGAESPRPASLPLGAASASASACPLSPSYPLPAAQSALLELAARIEAVATEPACLADPFFHAWRGAVLLAGGDPAAAVEPLERALLLQPDLPSAQLDLALAFAGIGEAEAARELFAQLEQRDDLPQHLRGAIAARRAGPAPVASPRLHSRWQFGTLLGVENNLNNAPAVSELTLTFPDGPRTLPLAPSSQPRAGGALLASARWQGLRPSGRSLWVFQAEGRARQTSSAATDFQQADLSANWLQAPQASRQWIARGALTWLRFGGSPLLRVARASLQYQTEGFHTEAPAWWVAQDKRCRPGFGLDLDHRHFPLTPELDGTYQGLLVNLVCTPREARAPAAPRDGVLTVQLRAGRDQPARASRPGGEQRRGELRAGWDAPLPSPWAGVLGPGRMSLQGSAARQVDSSGYSPLLSSNAVRRSTRYAVQAELSFALGGGLQAVGAAEASVQRSNLPAFTGRQRSLYMGLRWELL